jgi:hypothetical protein
MKYLWAQCRCGARAFTTIPFAATYRQNRPNLHFAQYEKNVTYFPLYLFLCRHEFVCTERVIETGPGDAEDGQRYFGQKY